MVESRRTVTVLFSDVSGSTQLGERLDAEAVRRIIERYFDEARSVLEHHGGSVEKFIGDAVMAVFGIPQLHEDDGLRAVRAATELHQRIEALSEELEGKWGARIAIRTGVNTGEVVAGGSAQDQRFATGDAVNLAQRLEQAAAPGEILIGDSTRRLLGDSIRVGDLAMLSVKGKSDPVRAWRLLDVLSTVPAFRRSIDAPFVGRELELETLLAAYERTAGAGACHLVTVLGPAGLGKSRLARELVTAVGQRARVAVGRCLPYGEGITYWPLAEIVQQVAGRDSAGLEAIVGHDEGANLITERIAGAVGRSEAAGRSEEISWAVRKLFEALAAERPLIVVFDDIHWAEPAFLDLIEYLVNFAQGPILILALARPDLLDLRGSWGTPQSNASIIALSPLSAAAAESLVDTLAREGSLPEPERVRIVAAAEGNPLFLEQMLALQVEQGGGTGDLAIPPTIHALLAARIDRLDAGERAVIERAAIEGRNFHRSAVAELLTDDERDSLGSNLMSLVRKEFIRPDEPAFVGDDGFRFAHALIREAAYGAMAKELRAELHERFAGWLALAAESRLAEYQETLGYHLEQAYRYREELGPVDETGRQLAQAACVHLTAAAARAIGRGDRPAQVKLLSRAIALLPADDVLRPELQVELGYALTEAGDFAGAEAVLGKAVEAAGAASEARVDARAQVALAYLHYSTEPGDLDRHREDAEAAIPVLEAAGDELGLTRAWDLLAWLDYGQGRSSAAEEAWERSIEHARQAGSRRDELAGLSWLASIALWGPMHREEARVRCEEVLQRLRGDLAGEAQVLGLLGCLHALAGGFDEARALRARREAIFDELGLELEAARHSHSAGWIEMLAGDLERAEEILRRGYETLERLGAKTQLQVVGSYLARALSMQGRHEEAERLASFVEQLDPTGVAELASARCVRAISEAHRGRLEESERLAREAIAMIDATDFLIDRADARMDLAEVLRIARRPDEAVEALDQARRLHGEKGNVVSVARADALLAALEG
jgi:class 3 adenylate cyclase/tetratricopeptide (TPR) repeat protein